MRTLRRILISLLHFTSLPSAEKARHYTDTSLRAPWSNGTRSGIINNCSVTSISINESENKTNLQASTVQLANPTSEQLNELAVPVVSESKPLTKTTSDHIASTSAAKCNHPTPTITTSTTDHTSTETVPSRGFGPEKLAGCNPPEVEALISYQSKKGDISWVTYISVSSCAAPGPSPRTDCEGTRFES